MNGRPTAIGDHVGDWATHPDRGCYGCDTEAWFPEQGAEGQAQIKMARRICRRCPVQVQCAEYAIAAGPRLAGIWGGLTERERNRIREERERGAA